MILRFDSHRLNRHSHFHVIVEPQIRSSGEFVKQVTKCSSESPIISFIRELLKTTIRSLDYADLINDYTDFYLFSLNFTSV